MPQLNDILGILSHRPHRVGTLAGNSQLSESLRTSALISAAGTGLPKTDVLHLVGEWFVTTEKIGPVHHGNAQRNDSAAGIFAERV